MNLKTILKSSVQKLSFGQFVYRYPHPDRVYLTFDDGPDASFTHQVLDILAKHKQRATFFLIGEHVEAFPAIALDTLKLGHRLGLHTQTHLHIDTIDKGAFNNEVQRNQEVIQNVTGEVTTILRPPRGRFKLANLAWAKQLGVTIVHYTVTSNDWKASCGNDILDQVNLPNIERW